ncbi:Peroxisomal membrane protein pex16 [Chamberlinius hualienensis]
MDDKLMSLFRVLRSSWERYQGFVKKNIDILGEVEGGLKWISYLVAGQSKESSQVYSELLYSSSNILLIINDSIIRRATIKDGRIPEKILWILNDDHFRVALTLIDYLEVFIEYSCLRLWGNRGKWLAVTLVQLCKAVLRLTLLITKHAGFIRSPAVTPLTTKQRKCAQLKLSSNESVDQTTEKKTTDQFQMTFTLKRSGRTIRTMSAAPTALGRSWQVPQSHNIPMDNTDVVIEDNVTSTVLDQTKFLAEIIHIFRPIVHLIALQFCGLNSWKPWVMALGMDVTSLRLIGDPAILNRSEQRELRFRSWGLLFYLLRSPFFERHTKEKIIRALQRVARTVPGSQYLLNPLVEYLPTWQKVYFYTWNN